MSALVAAALGACVLAACGGHAERDSLLGAGGTVADQPAAGNDGVASGGRAGASGSGGRPSAAGTSGAVAGSGGAGAEAGAGGSSVGHGGAVSECAAIEYMDLGGFDVSGACPASGNLPECDGGDEGAYVARTAECWAASLRRGCEIWAEPTSTMLVAIPYFACGGWAEIRSVLGCADSIAVEYELVRPCTDCDGPRTKAHILRVANDARPVITSAAIEPACRR